MKSSYGNILLMKTHVLQNKMKYINYRNSYGIEAINVAP